MQDKEADEFRETDTFREIWKNLRQDKVALFSAYLFFIFILCAIFAPWISPYDAAQQFTGKELMPPSWNSEGDVAYFFGTDDIGRDLFSRLILGISYTFGNATIVVICTAIIGGVLGALAGMSKGLKAQILGHLFDVFLSIPILLIAIVIATLMQPSLINTMLATLLALLPHFIHEIYQAIQKELKKDYVLMLRLDGASDWQLLRDAILPNIMTNYLKEISRAFTLAILDISALSFISLGAQRPMPEWGAMLRDSLELIYLAPWTVILPGLAIIVSILIVIIFGNGLCKAIDKYYE